MTYTTLLCNKFNEAGIVGRDMMRGSDESFTKFSEFIQNLCHLPEESIKKILELDVSSCKTEAELTQLLGRNKLLQCEPKIVDKKDNPTLMLRYNRYLHLFRGYDYQVSCTSKGIGSWSNSYWGIRSLLEANRDLGHTNAVQLLLMAAAIDSAGKLDSLWKTSDTDNRYPIDLFFEWMDQSLDYFRVEHKKSKDVYYEYTRFVHHDIDTDNTNSMYQFVSAGKLVARAYMDASLVQVETADSTFSIIIPDWLAGMSNYKREDCGEEWLACSMEHFLPKPREYQKRLLQMALTVQGINMNSVGWHTLRELKPMKSSITYHNYVNVERYEDIE